MFSSLNTEAPGTPVLVSCLADAFSRPLAFMLYFKQLAGSTLPKLVLLTGTCMASFLIPILCQDYAPGLQSSSRPKVLDAQYRTSQFDAATLQDDVNGHRNEEH